MDIVQQDLLALDPTQPQLLDRFDIVVMNPPFGAQMTATPGDYSLTFLCAADVYGRVMGRPSLQMLTSPSCVLLWSWRPTLFTVCTSLREERYGTQLLL